MRKTKPVVSWDKPAYASLQKIFEYIRQDSLANADKVRKEILKITRSLADHPERYLLISSRKAIQGTITHLRSTLVELPTSTPKKKLKFYESGT